MLPIKKSYLARIAGLSVTSSLFLILLLILSGCGVSVEGPDVDSPSVVDFFPRENSMDVRVDSNIRVTFSEEMAVDSINSASFIVTGEQNIPGTFEVAGNLATFIPSSALNPEKSYTVIIRNTVADLVGNQMKEDFRWQFFTGAKLDRLAPVVHRIAPANDDPVPLNTSISVTFTKTLGTTPFNVQLRKGASTELIVGSVAHVDQTLVFDPSEQLEPNTKYVLEVQITGLDNLSWSFTTGTELDSSAPFATTVQMPNSNIAANDSVYVIFNEALDVGTFNKNNFYLEINRRKIDGKVKYFDKQIIFTPAESLLEGTYEIVAKTTIKDLAGNSLDEEYRQFVFVTTSQNDNEFDGSDPVLLPTRNSSIVSASSMISVTFENEILRPDTIHAQVIKVIDSGGATVAGEVFPISGGGIKFDPTLLLGNNQLYSVKVSGVMDLAGNSLSDSITWSFRTENIPDTTAPTVESQSPDIKAQNVPTNQSVSIAFDEELEAASINQETLVLETIDGIPVSGTVTPVNQTVLFTPDVALTPRTVYVVTVKAASIVDLSGNALSDDISWQFTTVLEADVTSPTVLSNNSSPPAQQNIEVIGLTIAVQFSEAINESSILQANGLQVSIVDGAAVPGAVSVEEGSRAIFTPETRWNYNESYEVVVNENVADLAGNILGAPVSWVFSTKSDDDAPTVETHLPSPDASNVKVSTAIINANFSEVMAKDTITKESFYLTKAGERVTASVNYEGTTAVLKPETDLEYATQYQVTLTTQILDLVGNALGENVQWQFTTEPSADGEPPVVQSTNPVADENDVAIGIASIDMQFSKEIASNSLSIETIKVIRMTDNTAVTGQFSVSGTTVVFQPEAVLDYNTQYSVTISTGVTDITGKALSEAYTFTFTTTVTQDVTPPNVDSVLPSDGATDIVADAPEISVTFSEEMASALITTDSFSVREQAGEKIGGEIIYASRKARFVPDQPLAFNTSYIVELNTQITDLAGNPLSDAVAWSFTVQANPDKERPTVSGPPVPFFEAKDVEVTSNITVIFSEAMDPNSINSESFIVTSSSGEEVTGSYSHQNNTATFDPDGDLPAGSRISMRITPDITDEAGNGLANPFTWWFDTKADADTILPTIQGLPLPTDGRQDVTITAPIIRVEFSEEMDEQTINEQTFTLTSPQGAVNGEATYDHQTATFTVTDTLAYDTTYTATLTRGVKDLAQNALAQDFVWSFHTKQASPTVSEMIPASGAIDVPLATTIDVIFSEAMKPSTINTESFSLTEGANPVAGTVTPGSNTAQFKPNTELLPETTYMARLTKDITDEAGNALVEMQWSFTTKALDPNAAKEISVPHTGVVEAGNTSFQRYAIKNLAAGQHIVSISGLDNDVNLQIYNQDFTESLCFSELTGRLADFCVASTSSQKLYLEVQNTNDSADSTFTINAQPLANIATALPKNNENVDAKSIKFYQVTNELSQDVIIRQWGRGGDVDLYVYSDLNDNYLCRTQNIRPNQNYCSISTAGLNHVFVVVDGSDMDEKTVYSLSLETWQVISVNQSSDSVGENANFYRLNNLTAGINYKVELSNMTGLNGSIAIELNADINAINGKSCSSGNNATPPSCQAVANGTGELYLVVDGYRSLGTNFDLTITPVE